MYTKLAVLSAVHGLTTQRGDIYPFFLDRMKYLRAMFGIETLVVGSEGELSRKLTEDAGCYYFEHRNNPVSGKWNAGMAALREHEPTHVMILGSDDFVSDSLIKGCISEINRGHDGLLGITDSYFTTLSDQAAHFNKCIYWRGYPTGKIIGSARCIPKEILDIVDWEPWPIGKNSGLDFRSLDHLRKAGCDLNVKKFNIREEGWLHIDIKTRGNISSMSPLVRESEIVDFDSLLRKHLPPVESDNIIRYKNRMVKSYNEARK